MLFTPNFFFYSIFFLENYNLAIFVKILKGTNMRCVCESETQTGAFGVLLPFIEIRAQAMRQLLYINSLGYIGFNSLTIFLRFYHQKIIFAFFKNFQTFGANLKEKIKKQTSSPARVMLLPTITESSES